MSKLLYKDISYEIRGACFDVYNELGGGIKEKVIERALVKEISNKNLEVDNQVRIDITYQGDKVGTYIPDFIVENKIIIELKSKPTTTANDKKQFWSYLKGSDFKLGFLVNFSPKKLFIDRFVYTEDPKELVKD